MGAVKVIQRHEFADYLNCGTSDSPDWKLMGTGFTSLNESPNAQTNTKKYVNEKSSTTSITQYQTEFPYDADLIASEEAVITLYNIARNHATGSDAILEYVRVELWDPAEENSTTEFKARKFSVANSVSDIEGDDDIVISGTLHAQGDPVDGSFNISSKTFTAASGTAAAASSQGAQSAQSSQSGSSNP